MSASRFLFVGALLSFQTFLISGEQIANPHADINSLIFVHVVWRHGDRTPSILIPSDTKNNISTWAIGLGELTTKGMAQQYLLGKYLRARYDGFLATTYSPFEVYFRSSDYNRTLASAQANAAGLFSPTKKEMFTTDLKWRPIPIHTLPKHTDKILFDNVDCPTANAEEQRLYSSEEVKEIERSNAGILRYLGEKSGFGKIPMALKDVWKVFDPLNSEFNHLEEHTFPDWVNESIRQEIWEIYNISCHYLYGSDLMTRLRAGPFFIEILNRMKNVVSGINDKREKLFAYSAHDTSVAGILSAFGVQPKIFPHYATLVLIELHRDTDGQHFIKLFYKNETNGADLWELNIPNCRAPCFLSLLEEVRRAVIPLNWAEECRLYNWYEFDVRSYYFIIGVLFVICVTLFTEVAVLTVRLRRYRDAAAVNRRGDIEDSASQKFLLPTDEANYEEEDEEDLS